MLSRQLIRIARSVICVAAAIALVPLILDAARGAPWTEVPLALLAAYCFVTGLMSLWEPTDESS